MKNQIPNLTICVGVSLIGKSKWATEYIKTHPNTEIVERDLERLELFGEYRMGSKEEEAMVTKKVLWKIDNLLRSGVNVISSDTHLKAEYIQQRITDFESLAHVRFKVFPLLPKTELIKRNQDRFINGGEFKLIPESVLHYQIKAYKALEEGGILEQLKTI